MKKVTLTILVLFSISSTNAQFFKKLEKKLSDKAEYELDKASDKILNGGSQDKEENNSNDNQGQSIEYEPNLGYTCDNLNRTIFIDNFSTYNDGDFPQEWNSNSGGEIKSLRRYSNKFLKIPARSVVNPLLKSFLPEIFLVSFDLILPSNAPYRMAGFGFGPNPKKIDYMMAPQYNDGIEFMFNSNTSQHHKGLNYGRRNVNTKGAFERISCNMPLDRVIKVCIKVNGARVQVFVDGEKKIDMSKGFDDTFRNSMYFCASTSGLKETKRNYFYIGNYKIQTDSKNEKIY